MNRRSRRSPFVLGRALSMAAASVAAGAVAALSTSAAPPGGLTATPVWSYFGEHE